MTDPKVLADALVEAGILSWDRYEQYYPPGSGWYLLPGGREPLTTEQSITDWRVAGKLLESKRGDLEAFIALGQVDFVSKVIPLPRAIIEAWYAEVKTNEPLRV